MNAEHAASAQQSAKEVVPTSRQETPTKGLLDYCRQYARERPKVVALWCAGLGFLVGWKLRQW